MTEDELAALLRDTDGLARVAMLIGQGDPNEPRYWSTSDLGRSSPSSRWWWLYCEKCPNYSPVAFAAPVIRWGPNTTGDNPRRCARCNACGHKGTTIQHPGWAGANVAFVSFPVGRFGGVYNRAGKDEAAH